MTDVRQSGAQKASLWRKCQLRANKMARYSVSRQIACCATFSSGPANARPSDTSLCSNSCRPTPSACATGANSPKPCAVLPGTVAEEDRPRFVALTLAEFKTIHPGNAIRFGLRPLEFSAWLEREAGRG